jgi:hypothetical protein
MFDFDENPGVVSEAVMLTMTTSRKSVASRPNTTRLNRAAQLSASRYRSLASPRN